MYHISWEHEMLQYPYYFNILYSLSETRLSCTDFQPRRVPLKLHPPENNERNEMLFPFIHSFIQSIVGLFQVFVLRFMFYRKKVHVFATKQNQMQGLSNDVTYLLSFLLRVPLFSFSTKKSPTNFTNLAEENWCARFYVMTSPSLRRCPIRPSSACVAVYRKIGEVTCVD